MKNMLRCSLAAFALLSTTAMAQDAGALLKRGRASRFVAFVVLCATRACLHAVANPRTPGFARTGKTVKRRRR